MKKRKQGGKAKLDEERKGIRMASKADETVVRQLIDLHLF